MTARAETADRTAAAASCFDAAATCFARALDKSGPIDRFYEIGGCRLRLRFAGPALMSPLTKALEHLAVAPTSEAALTICLWDSESTQTPAPPCPHAPSGQALPGEAWVFNNDRFRAVFRPRDGILNWLDLAENVALYCLPAASKIPFDEVVSPMRHIISWWMRLRGLQFVHAGAVGDRKGAVVLAGRGGSGKSTTVLACVASGYQYLGDNYLLLQTEPAPVTYSVYNSATLHEHHLRRYPALMASVVKGSQAAQEKALGYLHEWRGTQVATALPVRAILLPSVTGLATTTTSPIAAAVALRALAPSSIFSLPGADRATLHGVATFVRTTRSYLLELGTDMSQVPRLVGDVLADVARRCEAGE